MTTTALRCVHHWLAPPTPAPNEGRARCLLCGATKRVFTQWVDSWVEPTYGGRRKRAEWAAMETEEETE